MVLQDIVIFSMSIADNIRLGKDKDPIEEVIKDAKVACIHE